MTRIAFISTMERDPWGGSEELWSQAALRLAQRGMTVGASVARHPEMPGQLIDLENAGCAITHRARPQTLLQRAARRVAGDRSLHWLSEFRPDFAVISQGENLSGCPWMAECARLEIPYVAMAHLAFPDRWPVETERRSMAEAYAGARASFFVSEAVLKLTRKQLASPLPSAQIVRNPFNVSYEASPPWPGETIWKLACVGRLELGAKGQDLLFDILREDKWRKRPIEVTIYGEGSDASTLRALQEMYELNDVHFAGGTKDIEAIWASHHALVLPSRNEGLPLVIVEAMLCGRPSIVTDVGGNAELIEDGVTGFLAAAPSAHSLDNALERAWQARAKWQEIGQAAARRVRELVPSDPVGAFLEKLAPYIPCKK